MPDYRFFFLASPDKYWPALDEREWITSDSPADALDKLLRQGRVPREAKFAHFAYDGGESILERFHFRCGGIRSAENSFDTRVP